MRLNITKKETVIKLQYGMNYCISIPYPGEGHLFYAWLDNIGVNCEDWICSHRKMHPTYFEVVYYFKREEDALLFALRWS